MNVSERTLALSALADDTRWSILARLGQGPATATEIARDLPITRQAVARHLDLLHGAGLVTSQRHGREVRHVAVGARLSALARDLDTVARAWETRLAAIKRAAEPGKPSDQP